jgi:hypothetical protein
MLDRPLLRPLPVLALHLGLVVLIQQVDPLAGSAVVGLVVRHPDVDRAERVQLALPDQPQRLVDDRRGMSAALGSLDSHTPREHCAMPDDLRAASSADGKPLTVVSRYAPLMPKLSSSGMDLAR